MRVLTFIFAFLFLSLTASVTHALDIGVCGTPEQLTEKLKAEDQHSFASAEHVTRNNNLNTLTGMIFTVNTDRSLGYILEADAETGHRATKICVYNRLAELRIFDARESKIPNAAFLQAPDEKAMSRCDELIKSGKIEKGTCGALNATLRVGEKFGERVLFQGFNVEKGPDGNYRKNGVLTTVTATLPGAFHADFKSKRDTAFDGLLGGILFSGLPYGDTTTSVTLVLGNYTAYGLSLLDH